MKKIICSVIVATLLSCTVPAAEIDLSGMTYEQLVTLKDQINMAMWNSQEWQEVTVPQGEWIVGEDIPAGHWTIKCVSDAHADDTVIEWGFVDSDGIIDFYKPYWSGFIHNPNNEYYQEGQVTEVEAELEDGMRVLVASYGYPAVFTPYSGKPDLGFK